MNTFLKYGIVGAQGMKRAILAPGPVAQADAISRKQVTPLSAGFCRLEHSQEVTGGYGTSLSLGPRPEDAEIISETLLLAGLLEPQPLERFHQCCSGTAKPLRGRVFWAFGFVSTQSQGICNLLLRRSPAKSQKSSFRTATSFLSTL